MRVYFQEQSATTGMKYLRRWTFLRDNHCWGTATMHRSKLLKEPNRAWSMISLVGNRSYEWEGMVFSQESNEKF